MRSGDSIANAEAGGASLIVDQIEKLPPVDGVVVATQASEHADVIDRAAISHSGPIFCEKPLTGDPVEADRLVADYGERLFVMDKWRYHPGVIELARIASTGELGEVQSLHSRRVSDHSPSQDMDTVWVHLPHDLSIALEILGDIPAARFAAEERTDERRIGLMATLGGPPWVHMETTEAAPAHRRELRMICSGGSAQLDGGWADEVTVRRIGSTEQEVRELSGELPLLAELRAFAEHVRGGPPPKATAADGALAVRRITELGELALAAEAASR